MKQKTGERAPDESASVLPLDAKKIKLNSPVVFAGFPDTGLVGTICINHMIEQMEMHQIAFVDSEYIMASALYVGKKLRHPFRIYANSKGTACALICEVPVLARGIRSITNAVLEWCEGVQAQEMAVLGGIAPTNISPLHKGPRSAFVLENTEAGQGKASGDGKVKVPTTAFVVGMGGALLSAFVTSSIKCRGVFVPSLGEAPDPGGAAILLEAVAELFPQARVDTGPLKEEAELIKRQLEELLKMQQKYMEEYEKGEKRPETERFYK